MKGCTAAYLLQALMHWPGASLVPSMKPGFFSHSPGGTKGGPEKRRCLKKIYGGGKQHVCVCVCEKGVGVGGGGPRPACRYGTGWGP